MPSLGECDVTSDYTISEDSDLLVRPGELWWERIAEKKHITHMDSKTELVMAEAPNGFFIQMRVCNDEETSVCPFYYNIPLIKLREGDFHCISEIDSEYIERENKKLSYSKLDYGYLRQYQIEKEPPKDYEKWTVEEENILTELYKKNTSIEDISNQCGRTYGAIYSRLQKLDLIIRKKREYLKREYTKEEKLPMQKVVVSSCSGYLVPRAIRYVEIVYPTVTDDDFINAVILNYLYTNGGKLV